MISANAESLSEILKVRIFLFYLIVHDCVRSLPKKNNNCLVKAKVKRTELLSAELMLHPIYLSIYLSIELESSGASLPISPTITQIWSSDSILFIAKFNTFTNTQKVESQRKIATKTIHINHHFPSQKKTHLIYIYTKTPSALSNISKLSKCSISHETHQMLYFLGVFKRMDQETIKAPPCGSPGPELHFPVLASQVPSSWAQLRASGMAVSEGDGTLRGLYLGTSLKIRNFHVTFLMI